MVNEKLVGVGKTLGWTAISCVSIYVIFGFFFLVIFTVLGFLAAIMGGSSSSTPTVKKTGFADKQDDRPINTVPQGNIDRGLMQ
jgi:hypothetical protein